MRGEICVTLRDRVETRFGSKYGEPWWHTCAGVTVSAWIAANDLEQVTRVKPEDGPPSATRFPIRASVAEIRSGVKRDGGQQMVNFACVRGATVDGGDLDGEHEANGLAVARRTGVPDGFFDVRFGAEKLMLGPDEIVLQFCGPGWVREAVPDQAGRVKQFRTRRGA